MKHVIVTHSGNAYMSVWQEDGKSLMMQLHCAVNEPVIKLDIQALPQLLQRLADVHNEVVKIKHPEIVSEGDDAPLTDLGESW